MYNALKIPQISQLTQVGIRDYCEEEHDKSKEDSRVNTFLDYDLKKNRFKGKSSN